MPGLLQGGRCKWSSHSCIQALARRHSLPTAWVKLLYHCFCWTPDRFHTAPSTLPLFLSSSLLFPEMCAALPAPITFFFSTNPLLLLLSAFLYSHTFTLANTRSLMDINTLGLKACPCLNTESATPSVVFTLLLVSHPRSSSITSSHSEAKEGMRSMDGCPELQLDTKTLWPPRTPSSSPCGDANKSESDLDKPRISPRSAGLTLTATADADSAETSLESLM